MGELVGYARVSTADQLADLQLRALAAAGVGRVFQDTISGTQTERPGLTECMNYLSTGDVLVVWRLDRLGRSLPHLLTVMAELDEREIGFRSLTEAGLDSTTPSGRLIFSVFAAVAQFERELIVERTRAGVAAARTRGKALGRPAALSRDQRDLARQLRDAGQSLGQIAAVLQVSRSTVKRACDNAAA